MIFSVDSSNCNLLIIFSGYFHYCLRSDHYWKFQGLTSKLAIPVLASKAPTQNWRHLLLFLDYYHYPYYCYHIQIRKVMVEVVFSFIKVDDGDGDAQLVVKEADRIPSATAIVVRRLGSHCYHQYLHEEENLIVLNSLNSAMIIVDLFLHLLALGSRLLVLLT